MPPGRTTQPWPADPGSKDAWRRAVRQTRRRRLAGAPRGHLAEAARLLARGASEVVGAAPAVVACYVSLPAEPPTGAMRARLRADGCTVLLPWLREDAGLDWVEDDGWAPEPGVSPVTRPPGRRLGGSALAGCTVAFVPALLVDLRGSRLGQGGGSYDRALAGLPGPPAPAPRDTARAPAARADQVAPRPPGRPLLVAVVHADEWGEEVLAGDRPSLPAQAHDQRVDAALSVRGLTRLGQPAGPAPAARAPGDPAPP